MDASLDLSTLMTAPVVAIVVLIAIITALVGYGIGRSNENKRKLAELKEADATSKAAIESLNQQHEQKINVLNKAHANDLDKAKQEHSTQIDQLNQAHQSLVDSLKTSHGAEIERIGREHNELINNLNETNNANVNALKQEQQRQVAQINERSTAMVNDLEERRKSELAELKQETAATIEVLKREQREAIESLRGDHQATLATLRKDSEQAVLEAKARQAEEAQRLGKQIAGLEAERDSLNATVAELDETITTLRGEIKESKLNNMFSVSKSGDKLIRVVRSVQELANELDETSRAVTNGEYSFFEQIKDQRDKEAVLSLTGGDRTYSPNDQEHVDEAAFDAGDNSEPIEHADSESESRE